jgi:transposase
VRWARRRSTAQALALRARIVLACADRPDVAHGALAAEFGVHRATVGTWRKRFARAGWRDCATTRASGPRAASVTPTWSAPSRPRSSRCRPTARTGARAGLAQAVGLKRTTVAQIWRAFGLQPHRSETFKLSTDPLFVEKVRDIVGLYLDPPARALVLCVDEKPSIQATEGTAPVLPMRPGQPSAVRTTTCGTARATCSPRST